MKQLLEKAAFHQLPEADKNANTTQILFVALILEEIESEHRWNEAFAKSEDKLAQLADEALAEFKQGKTKPLDC